MGEPLPAGLAAWLGELDRAVEEELGRWRWEALPEMERLVRTQVGRRGKRLRPMLMFGVVEAFGGDPGRVVPAAAGIELHHLASLVLDDIQDNAAFRRGAPATHVSAGVSSALNLAGLVRTLAYRPLHRSALVSAAEKLAVRDRTDDAAVRLYLGQSIDIGWLDGWYDGLDAYPYDRMIAWKTGALFGCAAWIAAFLARVPEERAGLAEWFGIEAGVLYQLADDYADFFGTPTAPAPMDDVRAGKPTWPLIALHETLAGRGETAKADAVVRHLREGGAASAERISALADRLGLAVTLGDELRERAERLLGDTGRLTAGLPTAGDPTALRYVTARLLRARAPGLFPEE